MKHQCERYHGEIAHDDGQIRDSVIAEFLDRAIVQPLWDIAGLDQGAGHFVDKPLARVLERHGKSGDHPLNILGGKTSLGIPASALRDPFVLAESERYAPLSDHQHNGYLPFSLAEIGTGSVVNAQRNHQVHHMRVFDPDLVGTGAHASIAHDRVVTASLLSGHLIQRNFCVSSECSQEMTCLCRRGHRISPSVFPWAKPAICFPLVEELMSYGSARLVLKQLLCQ